MAGYQVLAACAHSIADMLTSGFSTTLGAAAAPSTLLAHPEQVRDQTLPTPCVAVLVYRINLEPTDRSHPLRDPNPSTLLPISLHFVLCCFAATVEDELVWTGVAAQILSRQPIITGTMLLPLPLADGTTVNPWSPGDRVQIVADDKDWDSARAAIPGLEARPHLCYVATGMQIEVS